VLQKVTTLSVRNWYFALLLTKEVVPQECRAAIPLQSALKRFAILALIALFTNFEFVINVQSFANILKKTNFKF
jgi:hypothetical protein